MNDAVLVFAGLDPCGGAGIVADIESIFQFGLSPLPIITNLTVQNTASVQSLNEVDSGLITAQFNHLKADVDFKVVKIGLLSSVVQIKTITQLVGNKIVVLDPIVKPSRGDGFLDDDLVQTLVSTLLPKVHILTPNVEELRALSGEQDEQKAVEKLACEWILLTSTDASEGAIEHRLYHQTDITARFTYTKLSGDYHGSGCTLSSAISALLASGMAVESACKRALDYTYQTLLNAKSIGKIQYHPNRRVSS